jgi:hypothetical protein
MRQEITLLDEIVMSDRPLSDIFQYIRSLHRIRSTIISLREANENTLVSGREIIRHCSPVAQRVSNEIMAVAHHHEVEQAEVISLALKELSSHTLLADAGNSARSRSRWASRIITTEETLLDRLFDIDGLLHHHLNTLRTLEEKVNLFNSLVSRNLIKSILRNGC